MLERLLPVTPFALRRLLGYRNVPCYDTGWTERAACSELPIKIDTGPWWKLTFSRKVMTCHTNSQPVSQETLSRNTATCFASL